MPEILGRNGHHIAGLAKGSVELCTLDTLFRGSFKSAVELMPLDVLNSAIWHKIADGATLHMSRLYEPTAWY